MSWSSLSVNLRGGSLITCFANLCRLYRTRSETLAAQGEPPLGQHGHRTLMLHPEPPLVQLRAAHGVKAGDARDKWQGTLYHALYTIHIHTCVTV